MLSNERLAELREELTGLRSRGNEFFDHAQQRQDQGLEYSDIWTNLLTPEQRATGDELRSDLKRLSVEIAGAARGSPLLSEADLQDLRFNTRRILASLHFHK